MQRFKLIDDKLYQFAKLRNADVFTEGSTVNGIKTEQLGGERRILWIDDLIGKGIFIIPSFDMTEINSLSWEFSIGAWMQDGQSYPNGVPFWEKYLLESVEFDKIEESIDSLLVEALKSLNSIKKEDLRFDFGDGDDAQWRMDQ